MVSFTKEFIVEDLQRFKESIKEHYELENIKVLFEEEKDKAKIGFSFSKKGKQFKAFIPRTKLNNGEYEIKKNDSWVLVTPTNTYNENLLTIGHFMEVVNEYIK